MTILIKFAKPSDHQYFSMAGISSHQIMSAFSTSKPKWTNSEVALAQGSIIHGYLLETTDNFQIIKETQIDKLIKSGQPAAKAVAIALECERIARVVYVAYGKILEPCLREVVVALGQDGLVLKGKFDAIDLINKRVYDVKTTSNIKKFDESIESFNYGIQAAFYLRLAAGATGENYKDFYWMVVDKKTHKTRMVRCPDALIDDANIKIDQFLNGQKMLSKMGKK